MQEQLITFKTAKLAKEKGFDLSTNLWYNQESIEHDMNYELNDSLYWLPNSDKDTLSFACVSQSLLQRWLREKHNIFVSIDRTHYIDKSDHLYYWFIRYSEDDIVQGDLENYKTYEEALEAGLQEALELINN